MLCKKLGLALSLLSISCFSKAGIINFDSSITGADMTGISVTATFADNTYETFTWQSLNTVLGNSGNDVIDHEGYSGGVFGTNWSLTQQGFTLGNYDSGNVYGLWSFVDNAVSNVTSLKIDTNNTNVMFDTEAFGNIAEDTNGSGQGRSFITETAAQIIGTYSVNVQQELYRVLEITGLNGVDFNFLADTDKEDSAATPVVIINLEDFVNRNDVIAIADIDAVNTAISVDPTNTALVSYLSNSANSETTLLEAVKSLNLAALPSVGTEEEELEIEAAIHVVQAIIENQLKNSGTGSVSGNGDIEVIIDRDNGEVAIALTVADPEASNQSLDFLTLIDTPNFAFSLNFDFQFTTSTGNLEVYFEDDLLVSYFARDYVDASGSGFASLFISDPQYFGLTDAELKYSLFPGSPSSVSLKNINITHVVPTAVNEPNMAGASFAAVFLLLGWRHITNNKK